MTGLRARRAGALALGLMLALAAWLLLSAAAYLVLHWLA